MTYGTLDIEDELSYSKRFGGDYQLKSLFCQVLLLTLDQRLDQDLSLTIFEF